jgi:alanine racemase
MDQITIDLTDIPEACVGDSVTLIGEDGGAGQSADRLGEQAGTIS